MTADLPATIRVPAGFNGPRHTANGGVATGLLAALLDGPVEVRLSSPPPLDTDLTVAAEDEWLVARDPDGGRVLAARSAPPPDVVVPPAWAHGER